MTKLATSDDPPYETNGSVTPVSGISRVTPPTITNVCTPRMVASPAANSFENGRRAWIAIRNALPTRSMNAMTIADRAEQTELLTDRGEDEVGRRDGDDVGAAEPEPGALEPATAEPVEALHELVALVLRVVPRVEPGVDAGLHVAEALVRDRRSRRRT